MEEREKTQKRSGDEILTSRLTDPRGDDEDEPDVEGHKSRSATTARPSSARSVIDAQTRTMTSRTSRRTGSRTRQASVPFFFREARTAGLSSCRGKIARGFPVS